MTVWHSLGKSACRYVGRASGQSNGFYMYVRMFDMELDEAVVSLE
jgi:hypothetical protein